MTNNFWKIKLFLQFSYRDNSTIFILSGKPGNHRMKQIPLKISALYNGHLNDKAIPKKEVFNYRKWLRYYFDFCLKYNHNQLNKNNLILFIEKLKEKKQTEQQQKQAFHAISLYYELGLINFEKTDILNNKNQNLSIKKQGPKVSVANWKPIYDNLKAEISLRHYSPKTLRSYTGWIRRFQDYTKSKDILPRSL